MVTSPPNSVPFHPLTIPVTTQTTMAIPAGYIRRITNPKNRQERREHHFYHLDNHIQLLPPTFQTYLLKRNETSSGPARSPAAA